MARVSTLLSMSALRAWFGNAATEDGSRPCVGCTIRTVGVCVLRDGRDGALRRPRPRNSGRNEYPSDTGNRRTCAAARGADIAARCPYHAKQVPGRTPVPLSWKRRNRRNFLCLSTPFRNRRDAEQSDRIPIRNRDAPFLRPNHSAESDRFAGQPAKTQANPSGLDREGENRFAGSAMNHEPR